MFWITFFVSGLTIASIPWIASHFSNRIAGYILLVPVMMVIGLIVQYTSHGPKATQEMITGVLYGLPTLLVFGVAAIIAIKHHAALPVVIAISIVAWLLSLLLIHAVAGK
jgi:uncharacterized membrane protein (GlpM family)